MADVHTLGDYSVFFEDTRIPFTDPIGVEIETVPLGTTLEQYVLNEKESWNSVMEENDKLVIETYTEINGIPAIALTYELSNPWDIR
jgi:hypothetical protein